MCLRIIVLGVLSFVVLFSQVAVFNVFAQNTLPYPADGYCTKYKTTLKFDRTKVPNNPLSDYLTGLSNVEANSLLRRIKADQLCMQIVDNQRLIDKTTDSIRRGQLQKELESLEALHIDTLDQIRRFGKPEQVHINDDETVSEAGTGIIESAKTDSYPPQTQITSETTARQEASASDNSSAYTPSPYSASSNPTSNYAETITTKNVEVKNNYRQEAELKLSEVKGNDVTKSANSNAAIKPKEYDAQKKLSEKPKNLPSNTSNYITSNPNLVVQKIDFKSFGKQGAVPSENSILNFQTNALLTKHFSKLQKFENFADEHKEQEKGWWNSFKSGASSAWRKTSDYVVRSGEQFLLGNYSDETTLLGTGGQVVAGVFGVDAPMDLRDLSHDFKNWEWSWDHAGKTALDGVGLIPVIGIVKNADEVAALVKAAKSKRVFNITKSESNIWKSFKPFKQNVKTNGLKGKKKEYYQWDHTHNDIEYYDHQHNHLGSLDPQTGLQYKEKVSGRTLNLK